MRVCVVGSGGREHALAVALGRTAEVIVTPGNAGMVRLGVTCTAAPPEDLGADLYVIGPETPLVAGLADRLRAAGHLVFGPGTDGARLEGSKAWMKEVLAEAGVPTAGYATFVDGRLGEAVEFLRSLPGPWVVKTDGLAAGKGVLVTNDLAAAEADLAAKLSGRAFGEAGRTVVIEEGLTGPELSVMAVCDGRTAVALAAARDFKRAFDGDAGPNTGGMGAYSPVAGAGPHILADVMQRAVVPTLEALQARGIDYRGVLYAGLILTDAGPKVLEFNVRFGDPETQVVLPRWQGDVTAVLAAAAAGRLDQVDPPRFGPDAAVCVVLAAPGYPDATRLGDTIEGFEKVAQLEGISVYAAGVGSGPDSVSDGSGLGSGPDPVSDGSGLGDRLVTAGGRVLGLGATGPSVEAARESVYAAVPVVSWPGIQWRSDIAVKGEVNLT